MKFYIALIASFIFIGCSFQGPSIEDKKPETTSKDGDTALYKLPEKFIRKKANDKPVDNGIEYFIKNKKTPQFCDVSTSTTILQKARGNYILAGGWNITHNDNEDEGESAEPPQNISLLLWFGDINYSYPVNSSSQCSLYVSIKPIYVNDLNSSENTIVNPRDGEPTVVFYYATSNEEIMENNFLLIEDIDIHRLYPEIYKLSKISTGGCPNYLGLFEISTYFIDIQNNKYQKSITYFWPEKSPFK